MSNYLKSKKKYLDKQAVLKYTVPDYTVSYKEVCRNLLKVSKKLQKLLPDPSIGPEERIERLARVVPHSMLISDHHKTARSKLNYITDRLNQLVPDKNKSNEEKIDILVNTLHKMVPGKEKKIFLKLEKLKDRRTSDIGR
ncbi:MAG: hypothetical protein OXC37_04430 [Bdellovibrionaceae bacterium]|nr:hypothetical protein [Pseudobdellovibrionaceae bacterium]